MHITYITKLGPLGRSYTTRIDYGQSWSQAELDERVSAVCGLPPEQCAAVGRQYFLELLQAARLHPPLLQLRQDV